MSRPLPFRLRVPLAKILHAKQALPKAPPGSFVAAEELWDYSSKPDYLRMILTSKVYDVASETPMQPASKLSERLGNSVYFKREDLQPGFSFKVRGAYNKMAAMKPDDLQRGVLAHAVGGHAEGVAIAAHRLGVQATIVLPEMTGAWKQRGLERLGAKVILHGRSHSAAMEHCVALAKQSGRPLIPSFDDPYVIAGQGTVGLEILRQLTERPPCAIFVCVGGGGLLAGVAAYVKAISPAVKVIGVEAIGADAMGRSLREGQIVTLPHVDMFAEGAAVEKPGEETFRVCDELVDDMIVVTQDEICAAVHDGFDDSRAILEPAGALAIAGLKKWARQTGARDEVLVAITSGANITFDRLRLLAERALLGNRTEALLATRVPDVPGALAKLHAALAERSVTELIYRAAKTAPTYDGTATIFVSVALDSGAGAGAADERRGEGEVAAILASLQAAGVSAHDMSDNELAKSHMRYMSGGVKPAEGELLYRFDFPEQPGALRKFLNTFCKQSPDWNLTLLHYRYRGAEVSKVLTGIQIPKGDEARFAAFLQELGYQCVDETKNPAYELYCN
ncbi:hypothetical protein KFE25_006526 [Diacronema lutheri]|uniref:Threonine dehydratase n=2 Tax=Diacronema lutheri TaxID=2081491 RepID=A0A8J5X2A0_DIALT|nr:hypothetical protein KFE25_006526 [Diacronema lutheri]